MLVLTADKYATFGISATRISAKAYKECCRVVGDVVRKTMEQKSDIFTISDKEELTFDAKGNTTEALSIVHIEEVDGKKQLTLTAAKVATKIQDEQSENTNAVTDDINDVDSAIEFMYNVYGVEYIPEPEMSK